jgi:hypothetical protein
LVPKANEDIREHKDLEDTPANKVSKGNADYRASKVFRANAA